MTEAATAYFPNNFRLLTGEVLDEVRAIVGPERLREMFQRIAHHMAEEMPSTEGKTVEERLTQAVRFLEERGYLPRWERSEEGEYILHIFNCPYAGMPEKHAELCQMDSTLIQLLTNGRPERLSRLVDGDPRCTYRLLLEETPPSVQTSVPAVEG